MLSREAAGGVLAHHVLENRLLKKGALLAAHHIDLLRQPGCDAVYVAKLDSGDIDENEAARRVAAAVAGTGVFSPGAATGRANLKATADGLLRINIAALDHLNEIDDGITLATLPAHSFVREAQMVATVKIIPFAVPQTAVEAIEKLRHWKDWVPRFRNRILPNMKWPRWCKRFNAKSCPAAK